jgi:5-formyltetrahydrofolate cyclo-ligase
VRRCQSSGRASCGDRPGGAAPGTRSGLAEGKLLFMAIPPCPQAAVLPAGPGHAQRPPVEAAVHETAGTVARKVAIGELRPVDLVVCGSVAVNRSGVRLGKGGGYADLELALLVEAGLVSNQNRDRDDGACVAGGG